MLFIRASRDPWDLGLFRLDLWILDSTCARLSPYVCSLNLSCDLYEVFGHSCDSYGLLGLWFDLVGLLRSELWLVLIFLNWLWSCWCLTMFGAGYHRWGFHTWWLSHIDCGYMHMTLFLTFSLSRYVNFFIVDLVLLVTRFDPKSIEYKADADMNRHCYLLVVGH